MDEVVPLVVHALNDLGDRLLFCTDVAELHEVEPVSYTQLDVYKRQAPPGSMK